MKILNYENNLKKIRRDKKVTLNELSLLSGLSSTHINDIENYKTDMTITTLCLLANALQVYPCEICRCNIK